MPTGIGFAPIGTSLWGYGTVDIANSSSTNVLKKTDGTQGAVALIDPKTRDYVLDDTGQKVGVDSVPHMVDLALSTVRDSSAVQEFGLDLSNLNIFSANAQRLADAAVRVCLKNLTDSKLVSIQSVSLDKDPSQDRGLILVRWVDLTTANGTVNTAEAPLGS